MVRIRNDRIRLFGKDNNRGKIQYYFIIINRFESNINLPLSKFSQVLIYYYTDIELMNKIII